ncbi:hypothetical protein HZH68_005411 [Vespula germanica]|uniref:Uncharacterized protein n=1 Tax=Vespula germanica TaxID=30212 RepID=A0A834KG77_VESGE|nr:hypothetical protein HZH68_005411 [Vespula germanica]
MHSESLWSTNTVARGKGNKLSVGSYDGASPICFAISKDLLSHFILQSPPPMLPPIPPPPSSIPSPIPPLPLL